MYSDLVKRLRTMCPEDYNNLMDFTYGAGQAMAEAADAIEELSLVVESNERSAARWAETAGKAVEQIPRWVSVTERLPDAYEDVLLQFPNNQAAGFCDRDGCWGVYSGGGFYTEVADNEPKPTHWAKKLPDPPKGKGKG